MPAWLLFLIAGVAALPIAAILAIVLSVGASGVVGALAGGESNSGGDEGNALTFLLIAFLTTSTVGCSLWLAGLRWLGWELGWPRKWLMTAISIVVLLPVGLCVFSFAFSFSRVFEDRGLQLLLAVTVAACLTIGLALIVGGVIERTRMVTYGLLGAIPTAVWLGLLGWIVALD